MGYKLYATGKTHEYLKRNHVPSTLLGWSVEPEKNALAAIKSGRVDLVINIPKSHDRKELSEDYKIRRTAVDYNVPLITNAKVAKLFIASISQYKEKDLNVKSWREYRT